MFDGIDLPGIVRAKHGNIRAFAKDVGIPYGTIFRIIKNPEGMSVSTAEKFRKSLGMSTMDELIKFF